LSETEIVVERINGLLVSQAILTQGAIMSVMSKKGGKAFSKLLKSFSTK